MKLRIFVGAAQTLFRLDTRFQTNLGYIWKERYCKHLTFYRLPQHLQVGIRLEDCFVVGPDGKAVYLTEGVGGAAQSPWEP